MSSESPVFDIGTSEGRIEAANTTMRKKEAKLFIERELPSLKKKYKFVSRLATLVHNPHKTDLLQAWFDIPKNIQAIKQVLSNPEFNCIFALLTVETHTASHKKKSKKSEDSASTSEEPEQDKTEVSLLNYPHIHVAIAVNAPRGRLPSPQKIATALFEATTFGDDIHVDEASIKNKGKNKATIKKKDDENILCYCLKDSNRKFTYDMITSSLEHPQQRKKLLPLSTANNTILFNFNQSEDINIFFDEITKRGCIISIPQLSTNPSEYSTDSQATQSQLQTADTSSKFSVSLSMVIAYMIDNNLRKYEDDIFQLKPGTRRTWEKWGNMDRVFGKLLNKQNEEFLLDLLNNKPKIEQLAACRDQGLIPSLDLDWYFIEFEDFYLHLPSFSVLTVELPEDKHLAMNIPDYSLEHLKQALENVSLREPQFWLASILNQKFSQDQDRLEEFFVRYYKTLLPLIQKDKVLAIMGPPNSGKSSALYPLTRIMPPFGLTQFSDGQFSNSNLIGKRLVIADDTKAKILNNIDVLNIFEGGKMMIADRKFKDPIPFKFKGNVALATNRFPDNWLQEQEIEDFDAPPRKIPTDKAVIEAIAAGLKSFDLKPEIEARLAIYIFGTRIKNYEPGFMEKMTNLEIGKVIMFTGSYFASLFLRRQESPLALVHSYDLTYQRFCSDAERVFERN